MKRKLLLITFSSVLSVTASTRASNHFAMARWNDSATPTICQSYTTKPADCTEISPGIVCTTVISEEHTYTYFQLNACVTPWYRPD